MFTACAKAGEMVVSVRIGKEVLLEPKSCGNLTSGIPSNTALVGVVEQALKNYRFGKEADGEAA